MTKLLRIFPFLFLLGIAGCASIPSSNPTGEVVRYGACTEGSEPVIYEHKESTAGTASRSDLNVTNQTDTIQLRKNAGFGFDWIAHGLPQNFELIYAVAHPELSLPDGTTSRGFQEKLIKRSNELGEYSSTECYILSEDHELVPGVWIISIKVGNTILAKKSFNIVAN